MIRLRRKTKPVLLENKSDWSKDAKKVWIGGDHPIAVQSMTTGPGFEVFHNAWKANNVGFEILNYTMPTSDTATYLIRSERPNGSYGTNSYCLKRERDYWKILLDVQMNGSQLSVNGFLEPKALH